MESTKSADGTVIAYDRVGQGPPLVIVRGALCDRKTFVPPASLTSRALAPILTDFYLGGGGA
jgi:hypothetical protein